MAHTLTPRPKVLTLQYAASVCKDEEDFAVRFGRIAFDRRNHRAVAKFLPNKKGYRYERGKLIPRHAK